MPAGSAGCFLAGGAPSGSTSLPPISSSLSLQPRFSVGPSGAIEGPIAAAGPVPRTNGGSGDATGTSDSTADFKGGIDGARGPAVVVGGPEGPIEGPTMEALVPGPRLEGPMLGPVLGAELGPILKGPLLGPMGELMSAHLGPMPGPILVGGPDGPIEGPILGPIEGPILGPIAFFVVALFLEGP